MTRNLDLLSRRAARHALVLLLGLLSLAACGAGEDAPYIPGDQDEATADGDPWNPGDYDPDTGCSGEGEGDGECGGNADTGLDCTNGPCVFGQCVKSAGRGVCRCDAGYDGTYCQLCAEGYAPQGLRCVQTSGPCQDLCLFGACHVINEQPICECLAGYSGNRCDQCAQGYHEEKLRCVADEASRR